MSQLMCHVPPIESIVFLIPIICQKVSKRRGNWCLCVRVLAMMALVEEMFVCPTGNAIGLCWHQFSQALGGEMFDFDPARTSTREFVLATAHAFPGSARVGGGQRGGGRPGFSGHLRHKCLDGSLVGLEPHHGRKPWVRAAANISRAAFTFAVALVDRDEIGCIWHQCF